MSSAPKHTDAKIVIVDDEPSVVWLLTRALEEAGYTDIQGFNDVTTASAFLDDNPADLVMLDLDMPDQDAYALLEHLSGDVSEDTYLPVLAVGGAGDAATRLRAMQAGAKNLLADPIDVQELLANVDSLIETRFQNRRAREMRGLLEELVQRRTHELRQADLQMVELLGRVAELRDDSSGQHNNRVARLSALLARELHLAPEETELIMRAAPLHDLGNVAVGDQVLQETGGLTKDERKSIQNHTLLGADLLRGTDSDLLQMAERIALSHHERWDGQGYPRGLAGEDIPLEARIVCVADSFDALTHSRAYKEANSISEALAEIERESGWQFDPRVVAALVRVQSRERPMDAGRPLGAIAG